MEPTAGPLRAAPGHGAESDDSWTDGMAKALLIYTGAALAEIAGCFAFWVWLRSGKSPVWILPGIASLVAFAWLLTLIDSDYAGRAYAAYGGIYVAASIAWLWFLSRGSAARSLGHCWSRRGSRWGGHHPFRPAFDVGHARRSHEPAGDRSGGPGGGELGWLGQRYWGAYPRG